MSVERLNDSNGGSRQVFNLLDEPWIWVRTNDGETREVSLTDALVEAHAIACLAADIPTQDFAILRLMLAVLLRSVTSGLTGHEDPIELWSSLWVEGRLPSETIRSYLDVWHDRFDLFDPDHPFMQVPDLEACNGTVGEPRKLVADHPDGLALFSVKMPETLEELTFAEAARWLVHVQVFDTSGIKTGCKDDASIKKGKSYPIGCGWVGNLGGVYCVGDSLAKTLLLNLVLVDFDDTSEVYAFEDDLPVWEQPTQRPGDEQRLPFGMADMLTWQSRRVRLVPKGNEVTGALLTNGNRLDPVNLWRSETMTCWRENENQEKRLGIKPVYTPIRHDPSRSFWRGLASVLVPGKGKNDGNVKTAGVVEWVALLTDADYDASIDEDEMISVHATGISYGTQNAVISEMIDDDVRISTFLLSDMGKGARMVVDSCLEATAEAVSLLGLLARRIELAAGADSVPAAAARDAATAEAYFELGNAFLPWVASIGKASDLAERREAWHTNAYRILLALAVRLVSDANPAALVGRKVKVGKTEQWLSAGGAEQAFRVKLAQVLVFARRQHNNDEERDR